VNATRAVQPAAQELTVAVVLDAAGREGACKALLLLAQHAAQASELPMPSGCCSTMVCCLRYAAGSFRGVQLR
jgi:hypothetical protein